MSSSSSFSQEPDAPLSSSNKEKEEHVFFDTDAQIHDSANFDYFDAMEVVMFEKLLSEKMPPLKRLQKGISRRVEDKQQRLRQKAMQQRAALEQTIHKRKTKIRETMTKPDFVLTIDKVSFVGGVLIIMVTEFVLLVTPDKMGLLYSVLLFPLMALRYLCYRMDKMHYFMYDFCYFIQLLLTLNLHCWHDSHNLWSINFALTNGPLAAAVIMWRNSLVFHSMDKMTSSFIHMLPPLVTFCARWRRELLEKKFPMWAAAQPEESLSTLLLDFYVYPFGWYVLWQALYLFKTEIYSKRKLEYNTELMTSLRWLTKNPKSKSYQILNKFGKEHQLASFVAYQGIYTLVTLLPMPLLWRSMRLHALYLAVIFVVALTNGAAYYFHVFAVRYIDEIGRARNNNEETKQKVDAASRGNNGGGNEEEPSGATGEPMRHPEKEN